MALRAEAERRRAEATAHKKQQDQRRDLLQLKKERLKLQELSYLSGEVCDV